MCSSDLVCVFRRRGREIRTLLPEVKTLKSGKTQQQPSFPGGCLRRGDGAGGGNRLPDFLAAGMHKGIFSENILQISAVCPKMSSGEVIS